MRKGLWLRGLIGLSTAATGAGIAWAGYALMDPLKAGLNSLPPQVQLLPFDRGFWAFCLMLLGAATALHALPHPFWTRSKPRKPAMAPIASVSVLDDPVVEPPPASTEGAPAVPLEHDIETARGESIR